MQGRPAASELMAAEDAGWDELHALGLGILAVSLIVPIVMAFFLGYRLRHRSIPAVP